MLLKSPSMLLPLLFDNRICIENKSCKVFESCSNRANQTKRQSIEQLVCQAIAINHFDVVIFDSLEAIVIESKWSYHIYRLLTEVCHRHCFILQILKLKLVCSVQRKQANFLFLIYYFLYMALCQGLGTTKNTNMTGQIRY